MSEQINLQNEKTVYILVHTDSGDKDIDDEPSCGHLVRYILNKSNTSNIHITFSIKTKNIKKLLEFGLKPYTGIDFNPSFNFENTILKSNFKVIIVFHDGNTFLPDNYYPNYFLNISTGSNKIIKETNLINLRGLSHQGLPYNKSVFNDNDNDADIIKLIMDYGIPTVITTPFESFNTLFGNETFQKYEIPTIIHETIAKEGLNIITGRMSPSSPYIKYAESLINIRYAETLGKPATNSSLIQAIRSKYSGPIQEIPIDMDKWIRQACKVYLDSIREYSLLEGDAEDPIKFYEETFSYLYEMTKCLFEMNIPCFDESGIRLRYSTDDDIIEYNPEAFELFKKIGIFKPAGGLIAVIKLINMLES